MWYELGARRKLFGEIFILVFREHLTAYDVMLEVATFLKLSSE